MGLFDKIKDMMNAPEDEYYEDEVDTEETEADQYDNGRKGFGTERKSKITAMPPVTAVAPKQMQVVLVKPDRFEDASGIADHLNAKQTVVLNLEATKRETARRLIDFLSGVAYANKAEIKRVATNTFIITPYNVDVQGETMIDEMDGSLPTYL